MSESQSNPKYCFVIRITLQFMGIQRLTVTAKVAGRTAPLAYDLSTGKLWLPVIPGQDMSLVVTNQTPLVAGLPVRIGEGGRWYNIFRQGEVDPARMPAQEMWGVLQEHNFQPGVCIVDGFVLPDSREPFLVNPSGDHDLCFELYYRPPVRPTILRPSDDHMAYPGLDVVVYDADLPDGSRIVADIEYGAPTLIARIYPASRTDVAAMVAPSGIQLDPQQDYEWTTGLYGHGGRHAESVYHDLVRCFTP